MNPFDLSSRVALVTGAGRGLGFEIARALALAGARVVLNGRDEARLADAVARIGGDAVVRAFDITDAAAVDAHVAAIAAQHGSIDILVNNVGQRDRRALSDFAVAEVRALTEANLIAPLMLARAVAPGMIERGRGRIINITSIAGPISNSGDPVYTMTKGGLAALTRALAADLGPHGVTVNGIAPGFFATEANAAMVADAGIADWLGRRTSLKRWGRPEEVAGAAVFLASDAASYITGEIITVDGGYLAHF
ncbi:SDR family oxidoreductase [Sphingomonas sp. CCH10-B3]|uniref:SDR family oxidoreductase n=1 Tax=Sphingomonas TaxID=13687 RepID=UPI0008378008